MDKFALQNAHRSGTKVILLHKMRAAGENFAVWERYKVILTYKMRAAGENFRVFELF